MEKKVYGFVHTYQVHNWRSILESQLAQIEYSGLMERLDRLFIGAVGERPIGQYIQGKTELLYQINKPDLYEALTLSLLKAISSVVDGCVFYIHSKGVSRNSPSGQADWRRMMEYYTISQHHLCLSLLEKVDAVGVNWHLGEGYLRASKVHCEGIPVTPHFSGNFWWANTEYVRTLKPIYPLRSRFECEFWIGTQLPLIAELWNHTVDGLHASYPLELYVGKTDLRYFRGKEQVI